MKDHIRKQTSRPDRRVRRTEAEAQRSEAFSPTQHRCTCKNFTVSKKKKHQSPHACIKERDCYYYYYSLVSLHAPPPAARRLCQLKRIKRPLFRLIPAGSVGVVCAALMWRRKAGRRVRGGEMHHHRVQPRAHRVEQGRTFIPFPPTRCRRIPPACRGNSNGSTVSISAVDHHQRKREKKHVESFIFFQTTSTSLASLRTERVCVCFVLNETRLRRLNHSVFDSQAAVLQPPLLQGANCQHAVSLCVCWDGETTARSPSPIATVACFVCEWVTRGANLFSK